MILLDTIGMDMCAVDSLRVAVDSVAMAVWEMGDVVASPKMSIGELVMAILTLAAILVNIIFSLIQQSKHDKEMKLSQQQHFYEKKLLEIQHEFNDVKEEGYRLWNNGIDYFVARLPMKMRDEALYKSYEYEIDKLALGLMESHKRYSDTLKYYSLPLETLVPDSDGNLVNINLDKLIKEITDGLAKISSLIIFFEYVSYTKEENMSDMIKKHMKVVKLSPVSILDDQGNNIGTLSFERYCEACEYDFTKMKISLMDYMKSTINQYLIYNGMISDYVDGIRYTVREENMKMKLNLDIINEKKCGRNRRIFKNKTIKINK